jgi:2-polyprenyl-3-methyl-5-hydroxy-6-metoxy-1,4-benzoquinol methylase
MTVHGDNYVLDSGKSGHARLRVISEIHDDRTRALLLGAGLEAGDRYVEFGCGLGYVTRWATSMGADALGIDLSAEQIAEATELAEGKTEFRVGSVYDHGLPPESFDVSYSRWLLIHLNEPVEAMRSIYATLKPGGLMVCEEADLSAIYTEPPSAYDEFLDLAFASGAARGVDYAGGRRLHRWALEAGFDVLRIDAYHPHYLTGEHKGFWGWTFRESGANLVKEGAITDARYEELSEGMRAADDDPSTLVAHARMHQLVARKPEPLR